MSTYSGQWHLSAFPSETLGSILSFVDLWSVARLFCCGSKKLNKNLLSASGVRHIELPCRKYLTIHLPRVLTQMKGLKSVRLASKDSLGEFSRSSLEIMSSLPPTLESLTLKGFYNVSSILMRPKSELRGKRSTVESCYPNLTSLVVFADDEETVDINKNFHANLPPNLTKLQLPSVSQKFLGLLPSGLVTLKLAAVELQLLGSWIRKLPSLTKLQLSISEQLSFDADGIKQLPSSLTWLSFGVTPEAVMIRKGKKPSDEVEDLKAGAKFIFEHLPENLLHLECSIEYEPQDVARLSCWASLKSMIFAELEEVKLPPNLTSLCITTYPSDQILTTLGQLPAGLTTLMWDTWDPRPEELSLLPTGLTFLNCGDLSDSHLHLLPASLTHLECRPTVPDMEAGEALEQISGLKPFLEALPKVTLKRLDSLEGWSWVRVKDLGKFVYKNRRGAPGKESEMVTDQSNQMVTDQSDQMVTDQSNQMVTDQSNQMIADQSNQMIADQSNQMLFSGVGGSGWTCLGHAIELDNPELADDILNFNPRLEYQLYDHAHFLLAVRLGSINMLQWFEKKRALSFYREYEEKHEFEDGGLLVAFKEKHKTVSDWLLTRHFTVNLTGMGENLIDVAIRRTSSSALAWALDMKEKLVAKQEKGETLSETEQEQLTSMLEGPTPHTLSIIHNASECWHYLLKALPLRKWPDRDDARLLSPDVDLFHILDHQFTVGYSLLWVDWLDTLLLDHNEAIKEAQASQHSAEASQSDEETVAKKSKSKKKTKSSPNANSSKSAKSERKAAPKSKKAPKSLRDVSRMSIGDCVVQAIVDAIPGSIRGVKGVLEAFRTSGVLSATHVSDTSGISLVTACAQLALRDADLDFSDDSYSEFDDSEIDSDNDEDDSDGSSRSNNSDDGSQISGQISDDDSALSDDDDDDDDDGDIGRDGTGAHRAITKLFLWLHNYGADVWNIDGMGGRKKYTVKVLAEASGCDLLAQAIASGRFQP